jgi:hypothetical protein
VSLRVLDEKWCSAAGEATFSRMKALVVSGTLGVGKTYTAAAIRDGLLARGQRVAVIDLDWLCQADPAPANDPYNYGLGFRNLAAVFPNYVAAGADYLFLPESSLMSGTARGTRVHCPGPR